MKYNKRFSCLTIIPAKNGALSHTPLTGINNTRGSTFANTLNLEKSAPRTYDFFFMYVITLGVICIRLARSAGCTILQQIHHLIFHLRTSTTPRKKEEWRTKENTVEKTAVILLVPPLFSRETRFPRRNASGKNTEIPKA